ncbi:MAG TPA: ribose-5-phosphate isomerase RpiA [Actinomycetes bacterium]|nr:ribose-5-phosphate isomerase RpiA [Actinomycetes bacterium]
MSAIFDDPARAAAVAVARTRVEAGMVIGLGSGRAVSALVDVLASKWPGRPLLRAVAASTTTAARAEAAGIELVELDDGLQLDLAVDGADEVDHRIDLIKGGGAALLREKLVLAAARRVVIVAEASKYVERLGSRHELPIEVVRFGWPQTRRRLLALLPTATRRVTQAGEPVVTDEGHYLVDCAVPAGDLGALAASVKATLGVVEHGLFLGMADEVILGRPDGSVRLLRRQG